MEYLIICDYFYYTVVCMSYKIYFQYQVIGHQLWIALNNNYVWLHIAVVWYATKSNINKNCRHPHCFACFWGLMKLFKIFQHLSVKKGWFNLACFVWLEAIPLASNVEPWHRLDGWYGWKEWSPFSFIHPLKQTQRNSCSLHSGQLTSLAEKWTRIEDAFPIEHGDIPSLR